MDQALGMLGGFGVGVLVSAVIGREVVLRLGLPWREALMYFGVLPYPEEVLLPRRASRRTRRR